MTPWPPQLGVEVGDGGGGGSKEWGFPSLAVQSGSDLS
jgi:hypothetical protein